MRIVIIYSPSSCSKPERVPFLQIRYFEECWSPNTFWSPLTFITFCSHTMEVNGYQQLLFAHILCVCVFSRIKGFKKVWNNMRLSKPNNFHFWWTIPFKEGPETYLKSYRDLGGGLIRVETQKCSWTPSQIHSNKLTTNQNMLATP